ncbi:protease complex subunit PrcB family protein [Marinobacter sp. R17]|uniref:protease complex subunit PrcB family protein n=1 Tax=Marinobacter sp. R17 TaxID=2484250 RepID=UPI000F4C4708|nr:protease complex subunit PrcB family protein [Marinobacter sp. R17]ROU02037.1 protease complex subunit PrcB family protein [Marinobacter sp. R17]
MNGLKASAILVLGLSGLAGCAAMADSDVDASQEVGVLMSSQYCGFTAPGLVLATDRSQWAQLSSASGGSLPPWPEEAGQWLLVANLGQKPTGGHRIDFKSASRTDRNLSIEVAVRQPAADAMVTQALTTPCLVMVLPAGGWDTVTVEGAEPFPVTRQHP